MSKSLRVIFAGTPDFSVPCLQALIDAGIDVVAVYTQPDRKAGRGLKMQMSPVKSLALRHDIPVEQPTSLKDATTLKTFKAYRADLMVVVAYGLLLPTSVLETPRYGCINVHASLLPRWRGASPIQHTLLAGDAETGITYMLMDEGLDTGPMLDQYALLVRASWTAQALHDALALLGAKYLLDTIEGWISGEIRPTPQEDSMATYAPKINKIDAQLNWVHSAQRLNRLVLAYNPWPIAYSILNGERLRIYKTSVSPAGSVMAPGTIVHLSDNSIDVACGQDVLCLHQCQLPGGKVLPVAELLKSKRDWFAIGRQFELPA